MHTNTEKAFSTVGAVGYCARGVVFGLIGAFLVKAAVEDDPKEAIALDGALGKLAHASGGTGTWTPDHISYKLSG